MTTSDPDSLYIGLVFYLLYFLVSLLQFFLILNTLTRSTIKDSILFRQQAKTFLWSPNGLILFFFLIFLSTWPTCAAIRLLWSSGWIQFPFLSPIVSSLLATATVSNCFLLSDFFPLSSYPSPHPFFCHLFSCSRQMIVIEEHKGTFRDLTPGTKAEKQKHLLNEESFFF